MTPPDTGYGNSLAEIKVALHDPNARMALVPTFTHGRAVQVYVKSRKVGPLIIPNREAGQSLGDVLKFLGELAEGEES